MLEADLAFFPFSFCMNTSMLVWAISESAIFGAEQTHLGQYSHAIFQSRTLPPSLISLKLFTNYLLSEADDSNDQQS